MKNKRNYGTMRTNRKDIWNAFMVIGATFTANDIPICPTTATAPPEDIVTWEEAKSIYKKQLRLKTMTLSTMLLFAFTSMTTNLTDRAAFGTTSHTP